MLAMCSPGWARLSACKSTAPTAIAHACRDIVDSVLGSLEDHGADRKRERGREQQSDAECLSVERASCGGDGDDPRETDDQSEDGRRSNAGPWQHRECEWRRQDRDQAHDDSRDRTRDVRLAEKEEGKVRADEQPAADADRDPVGVRPRSPLQPHREDDTCKHDRSDVESQRGKENRRKRLESDLDRRKRRPQATASAAKRKTSLFTFIYIVTVSRVLVSLDPSL